MADGNEDPKLLLPGDDVAPKMNSEVIMSPAKVLRIGSMIRALLEEVKSAPLDENSRSRLAEIYDTSVTELGGVMSEDLTEELRGFAPVFHGGEVPSEAELRIAQAQLVGWLEGLFHGIQATLMAQQMDSQSQLQELRNRSLPQGAPAPGNYL
ncbi:proteasome activator [Ferrimicrobium sp.]|uniref:proteasome activator n=1 Tax=Ferrimicrobium sp. TaxID=2926050 RepID=UPI002603453A|nr:proteasome activator [Ferrimicrobium sp.]